MTQAQPEAWLNAQSKLIYPPIKQPSPYYISAPRYKYASAGVRALYLLCHALNRRGFEAYITNHPWADFKAPWTTMELKAPMLTKQVAMHHYNNGITPIVVYPETVTGNPLAATLVARWVLNFPGLLGGDHHYDPSDICYGFSSELADAAGAPGKVLHMPTVDTRIFHPVDGSTKRAGCCFYASKYRKFHAPPNDAFIENCFEITRDMPDSLRPHEIADLLRRTELLYVYENTALATEAVLCGCPAVFVPNPHLTAMIAKGELGTAGYAWGASPEEISRAKATVEEGWKNYLKTYDAFWEQLEDFIKTTQSRAMSTPYPKMVCIPTWQKGLRITFRRAGKECRRFYRKLFGKPTHQSTLNY